MGEGPDASSAPAGCPSGLTSPSPFDAVAPATRSSLSRSLDQLRRALDELGREGGDAAPDEARVLALVDEVAERYGVEATIQVALTPALRRHRPDGAGTAAIEHARERVVGRLFTEWLSLRVPPEVALGGRRGRAVLCELPEGPALVSLALALTLSRLEWRTHVVGVETSGPELLDVVATIRPRVLVLASESRDSLLQMAEVARRVARRPLVAVTGGGADPDVATALGGVLLPDDPVLAGYQLDALAGPRPDLTA